MAHRIMFDIRRGENEPDLAVGREKLVWKVPLSHQTFVLGNAIPVSPTIYRLTDENNFSQVHSVSFQTGDSRRTWLVTYFNGHNWNGLIRKYRQGWWFGASDPSFEKLQTEPTLGLRLDCEKLAVLVFHSVHCSGARHHYELIEAQWRHRSGLSLAEDVVWWLTAPNDYLSQWWRIKKGVLLYSLESNFTISAYELNTSHVFWDPLNLCLMGLLPDTQNSGCACAGNAGNVFPVTAGKRSRHASRHVRDARAVMHVGIAN